MISDRMQSGLNAAGFVALLTFTYVVNALPLGGVTQRELSAEYKIMLTPASYVFAIWGVIYLGLAVYTVVQALPSKRNDPRIRALDRPFRMSCGFNMLWLTLWHYRYVSTSVIVMLGLLVSVIWAYTALDQDRYADEVTALPIVEQAFSVYLGWVSFATILNLAVWFHVLGWTGSPLSPELWTSVMLVVACVLLLGIAYTRADSALLGVVSWASVGIGLKNASDGLIVATSAVVCAVSLFVAIAFLVMKQRR